MTDTETINSSTPPIKKSYGAPLVLFAILMAVGVLARLVILWSVPLERLIELWVTDDAFYYFVTADNWAHGFNSTFDNVHFTNGYHPLWMMMNVVTFWISGGAGPGAIKFMLLLGIVSQIVSAGFLYALARRFFRSEGPAFVAAGLFMISPSVFWTGLNGLETSLALALVLLFWLLMLEAWDHGKFHMRDGLISGVIAGLAFLARTDQIFYLFAAWGLMFVCGRRKTILFLITSGLTSLIVVLPWLGWNFSKTGHILQASAGAYPMVIYHHAGEYLEVNTFWTRFPNLISLFRVVIDKIVPEVFIKNSIFWGTGAVLIGLSLFRYLKGMNQNEKHEVKTVESPRYMLLLVPLGGLACLIFIHSFVRAYPRYWYFAGFSCVAAVMMGEVYRQIDTMFHKRWSALTVIMILALAGFYPQFREARGGFYLNQGFHRQAALWCNQNLDEGARIGAFNAGVFNYYCNHQVINLDGTSNNDVLKPLHDKKMWSYIERIDLDYIVDAKFSVESDYKVVMDVGGYPESVLQIIERIEHSDPNFEFFVYKIIKPTSEKNL